MSPTQKVPLVQLLQHLDLFTFAGLPLACAWSAPLPTFPVAEPVYLLANVSSDSGDSAAISRGGPLDEICEPGPTMEESKLIVARFSRLLIPLLCSS